MSIKAFEKQWADLVISINEHDIVLYFERIPNDPLYNLLESAIGIKNKRDSTILFHNGAQQEYLSVKRLENSLCRIEFERNYINLPIKQFNKTILRMFDSYTFDFSKEEYTNNWDTFPDAELERLRILYHTL